MTILLSIVLLLAVECAKLLAENRRQRETIRQLRYCSERDPLTDLKNRYAFTRIARELETGKLGVSVLVCDIVGLKRVNDTQGHFAGDRLIRQAAQIIKQACGNVGDVFRMGGDEFLVLLPYASTTTALQAFQREIAAAAQRFSGEQGGSNELVLSVGAACGVGERLSDIIKRADQAMYESRICSNRRGFSNLQAALAECEQ